MNKTLKSVLGTLVLIVILILFYFLTFQLSHKRLAIKETTSIVSINNLGNSKMDKYYKLYEKISKKDSKKIKEYAKYIKGIDLIYFEEDNKESADKNQSIIKVKENNIFAVNVGWAYPIAKLKQGEYFKDLGKNYFELKESYVKELNEKYGFEGKVYMTNYKGYYFLSDDVMKLSDYLRLLVKKDENKNIVSQMDNKTIGEAIYDLDLNKTAKDLTALKVTLDYKDGKVFLNGDIFGDIKFSEYFKGVEEKDRKLSKYMSKDRIYLTSQNFKGLTSFVRENINPQINNQLAIVKMLTGKEIEDYTDEIDGELIYDYASNQVILPLKDTTEIEKLLNMTSKKDGNTYTLGNHSVIELKDKTLYYNGEMKLGTLEVPKGEFINGSVNLGMYNPGLYGIYVNLGAKAEDKEIKIRSEISEEDFVKAYQQMEASRK